MSTQVDVWVICTIEYGITYCYGVYFTEQEANEAFVDAMTEVTELSGSSVAEYDNPTTDRWAAEDEYGGEHEIRMWRMKGALHV